MSRFSIISKGTGATLYSGTPTYTGTYMKPGMLEYREVASPIPISFSAGDYVVYTRTGQTFRLYSTPQVKKRARANKYGGAFVYQNVQLFDDSKQLEFCPFRDLVTGDNRIHFSTQPSISTFEGVDGIARRLQACLDDMYPGAWTVRLATAQDGASQALLDLMEEAREFTVSGVNLLEVLGKVYEIWPEVGWVYRVEGGTNTIVIGGGGLSTSEQFVYGKGNGLKSITRTPANADELANRIFAYGSTRNMLPRWYNAQNIKEKDSVDIQNLMIPVSEWGLTEVDGVELPDAAKAYVEDAQSIAKIGLRPKTVYFDGSGDYPEIYPTLRNVTIGDLRNVMDRADEYYPTQATSSTRVDKIAVAQPEFDSGLAGDSPGKTRVSIDTRTISQSSTTTASAGVSHFPIYHYQGDYTPTEIGNYDLSAILSLSGTVAVAGIENVEISIELKRPEYHGELVLGGTLFFKPSGDGVVTLSNGSLRSSNVQLTNNTYILTIDVYVNLSAPESDITCTSNFSGDFSISTENYRAKTFWVSIPQIGFDISEQAALGDGKTIAMRSGKCAGRSFVIDSVRYDSRNDAWTLTVIRSEDESLSQWFPNENYPIESGDEFVLLDIAMPDLYVRLAEQKLLSAARELLSDTAVERWQYVPEIDAKFMVGTGRIITAGQNMAISDADLIGDSPVAIIVDSISINEGEAAIPTYKVTLRGRKKKTFTESQTPESISSTPVTKTYTSSSSDDNSSASGASFFELDSDGNVKLKDRYANLWAPGWISAGGVQDGESSGGGGLITSVKGVSELGTPIATESLTETFSAKAIESIYESVLALQQSTPNVSLSNGQNYSTITVNGANAQFYTKGQVDSLLSNIDLSGYVTNEALTTALSSYATASDVSTAIGNVNVLTDVTTQRDGTLDFTWHNGDVVKVDLNHTHPDLVPITRTINGHPLSANVTLSATTDLGVASWAIDSGSSGSTIPFNKLPSMYVAGASVTSSRSKASLITVDAISNSLSSGSSDQSRIEWDDDNSAWHFLGNLYADGWVSAGGAQSGGSSSGGALADLADVALSNPQSGNTLVYNGTHWINTTGKTILGTNSLGTTIAEDNNIIFNAAAVNAVFALAQSASGGGSGTTANVAWGTQSGDTIILTVDGVPKSLLIQHQSLSNYVTLDSSQTITGTKTFSADLTASANLFVGGAVSVNGMNSIDQSNAKMSLFNYGARSSKTFDAYGTGANLRACDSNGNTVNLLSVQSSLIAVNSKIIPNYMTRIDLGGSSTSQRWATIYGVNADLTGNLSLSSDSYINLGPICLVYDLSENALHVTSNDNSTINLYCDGYISAGGVQASS